jgi:hypothetical protein
MKIRKAIILFVVFTLVILTAVTFAQTKKLKRIGLYTFVEIRGEVPSAEVMKQLFQTYASDIKTGFEMAGYPELYEPFMTQLGPAKLEDTTLAVGETMMWMMFKSQGRVKIATDIEWAGNAPLPIYALDVKKDWKIYHFVIPKPCGNIALIGVEEAIPPAICSLVVVPERANVGDPVTVDMSGTQNAKSMSVEVYNAQGTKIASQNLTPDSPKWQTKFDAPGEYSFKGGAVNFENISSTNPCASKVSINFPPICKLWTSCLPCEDYVGRPITFDASGSTDPDGEVVKVVFELLDEAGNVIDTCVTTRKPFVWEKVFSRPGNYTISVTAYDNDGAASPASDPCRLTFEVTQKLFFWMVDANAMLFKGSMALAPALRAGLFYWVTPNKWSFTLSAGGAIPLAGDPWKFTILADALINGHYQKYFIGTGVGFSSNHHDDVDPVTYKAGVDLVVRTGMEVFDKWTSKGDLFFEFRAPVGRAFSRHYKMGLGFRMLF